MIYVKKFGPVVFQVDYGLPCLWHANIVGSYIITGLNWNSITFLIKFSEKAGCSLNELLLLITDIIATP